MPPFLPRKRLRSPTPEAQEAGPSRSKGKGKAVAPVAPRKQTLFDALDAGPSSRHSVETTKSLLAKLASGDDDDSDLTSLSCSEPDFEDVPATKRQKIRDTQSDDDEDDEDIEFEDVETQTVYRPAAPPPSGDLDLTLTKETRISLINSHNRKQGPSKIERQIRMSTHCMHVQFLLWHNWIRNGWISDREAQQILIEQLGPNIKKEIEQWRVKSGMATAASQKNPSRKDTTTEGKKRLDRSHRNWGQPAERQEIGIADLSHGDPILSLMKSVLFYWKMRFRITAPGLRKIGYMSLPVLDDELKSFSKNPQDVERHGERVRDIAEFRVAAKTCDGSRDLSAQLLTALLRGIGLEARMVVSLQPVGFGWSKNEEACERLEKSTPSKNDADESNADDVEGEDTPEMHQARAKKQIATARKIKRHSNQMSAASRSGGYGGKQTPIHITDSEIGGTDDGSENESVIDVTPTTSRRGTSKIYEKDLPPNYWIEVLSPVTNTYYAVNPFNQNFPVANKPEFLAAFEPRGAKSEKAKQVMAYIVAFSPDGTAKDVTVRYLKRHMWPGKTKGVRIPLEKVPIYNHRGKVKRYEELDWFKTLMSRYARGSNSRTDVDDQEEATDLKAVKPEKKEVKDGEETLQSYKSSAEFVLERHLHREEALLPLAKSVRMFAVKGKKGEPPSEEKVFLRKDVVSCKSVETWHKEGREPRMGEHPLKRVPYRAATINRKRELAEAEAARGQKILQGLYSWAQTDWIIPPPIVDGIIPKNGYGNMDVYVPSMVPVGAVHIPRRRTKEICRKIGIDYAEAVTGFEFGARMAVPIITGVVIAEENEEMVLEQWGKDEAERARKEDEKRTKAALGMWRKFLMGMRIVERVREEYGDNVDDNVDVLNPWINKKPKGNREEMEEQTQRRITDQHDEDMAGGFLPEDHHGEEPAQSFFPTRHEDDEEEDDAGGFIVEGHEPIKHKSRGETSIPTPVSMLSNKNSRLGAQMEDSDDDDDDDDDNDNDNELDTRKKARLLRSSAGKAKSRPRQKKLAPSRKGKVPLTSSTTVKTRTKRSKQSVLDTDDEELPDATGASPGTGSDSDSPLSSPTASSGDRLARSGPSRRRRAPSPGKVQSQRAVTKRRAARNGETALRSRYFAHSGDDEEDNGEAEA